MVYISSDTNVWLDFSTINKLDIPFKLPYTYIMNEDAIENELLSPKGLQKALIGLGLKAVELSEEEFYLAEEYSAKYSKPSLYDCVALAIAKVRGITLMMINYYAFANRGQRKCMCEIKIVHTNIR